MNQLQKSSRPLTEVVTDYLELKFEGKVIQRVFGTIEHQLVSRLLLYTLNQVVALYFESGQQST